MTPADRVAVLSLQAMKALLAPLQLILQWPFVCAGEERSTATLVALLTRPSSGNWLGSLEFWIIS